MPATKGKLTEPQKENIRARIQTTQLINRLQNYALGLPEPNATEGEMKPAEIDSGRLKAIEVLLRKSLPDLSNVTVAGDPDKPLITAIERRIVRTDN